jgi:hypothetical protein
MKRLTLKQKIRQLRISKWRMQERFVRRDRRKKTPENQFIPPDEEIKAPSSFNLIRGGGKEVVKFLRAVSFRVTVQKQKVRLNFKDTTQFYVPGAILLFAELDRIVSTTDLPKPITIIYPRQRKSREVMAQIGLDALVGDALNITTTREDVIYWKAIKGSNQTGDSYGQLVEAVAEKVNRDHATQVVAKNLWRSVNEAIANTTDHAYKYPRFDGFTGLVETKWWMFTQIRDGRFTVAVCDLGCGYRQTISETIPEALIATVKAAFGSGNRDALAIETAMYFGRTGTKEHHRGKGSRDVLSLVKVHGNGEVTVISNTGWMCYQFAQGVQIDKNSGDLGIDFGGTIVWWSLPLKESGDDSR